MKIAFIIVGICIVIGIGVIVAARHYLTKEDPEYLLNYLKNHNNSSLTVFRNGQNVTAIRENIMFPLASTVKIMVAIEYAKQCDEGKLDPSKKVSLEELDQYYIPNTDGGAHESWIHYSKEEGLLRDGSSTLENVVKGMILFSSNANTEYMMNLLGIDNINKVREEMKMEDHEPLYPSSSAMLIPAYIKNKYPAYSENQIENKLRKMSKEEYIDLSHSIFTSLSNGEKHIYIENRHMDRSIQKIWSDRLTKSTTAEYAEIMGKLNSKTYFTKGTQERLDKVMEGIMENPKNQEWLKHAGQKGGSSLFVATNAAYATDRDGNSTEIVFFANDLEEVERQKVVNNLNGFNLKILRDEDFRKKLEEL
ncbi:serine hydrolase [Rossellomorea aquimaris]|nr:serine hydrolase [Rossellomorea aquimaris]WRP07741.1 serine hydrolase [Rossellomorea aquimaris]